MKNILIPIISILLFASIGSAENIKEKNIISKYETEITNIGKTEDYFRLFTGADITDYGQPGIPRYLSLLGLSNYHTLITLDGIRINSLKDGNANLNKIPIGFIGSIDLEKGVSTVSDGTNVFGGKINVLTFKPDSEIPYTRLYSRWGTSGMENYGINFINQNGSLRYSILADKVFSHGFGFYRKYQKYNAVNFYSKMDWYYSPKTWFTLTTSKYEDNTGTISSSGVGSDRNKDRYLQIKYETHQSVTALKIKFYGNDDWLERNVTDMLYTFKNSTQGNEGIIEQNLGKYHLIRVGKEHQWIKFRGNYTMASPTEIVNTVDAFYYEDEIQFNNLKILVGQRHDNNSLFAKEESQRLKIDYQVGSKTTLFLNAGQGISFPNYNDMYMQTEFYKGNPNLLVEKGWIYTLGMGKVFSDIVSIDLSGNYAEVNNFILWDYDSSLGYYQKKNVSSVTSKGAETKIKLALAENVNIQSIFTYLLTEDKEFEKSLPYRPRDKIRTNLFYKKRKYNGDLLWIITLGHEYQGGRYNDRDNTKMLKSFNIINMNISMVLAKAFTINIAGNNLGDNEYYMVDGYEMPKSNYWGGIIWEFWD